MSELIDTTEMYLRTIFELQEEGIPPLRARIAQRLGQSGPTVSQTVARMERDGLLTVEGDRHLELTPAGDLLATRVMRKHRLAECLLIQVIGLPWEDVHDEACRWEHVMSDAVERHLLDLLGHPTESPFGNPIPGLAELDPASRQTGTGADLTSLADASREDRSRVRVQSISEPLQADHPLMARLKKVGVQPGEVVRISRSAAGAVMVGAAGEYTELDDGTASHVLVSRLG
ncbi:MAG: metal-dependent transcriptional regulator [Actinomycetota bacterium]|nr:MAG: metal-dependent transcriptional regulator [Actinomycetota bacterium]